MSVVGLTESQRQLATRFAGRNILVYGDLMMDEYIWGRASRISPEAPVMVLDVERESRVPGGAANVVNNLVALGANVLVLGVIGDDEAGEALKQALLAEGANIDGIVIDPSRPTTRKTRIVAHHQQVVRIDREKIAPLSAEIEARLIDRYSAELSEADAVLISDYNKGVVTSSVHQVVTAARSAGKPVTANPKPSSAHWLAGASVVQLNQIEAEGAASKHGISDSNTKLGDFPNEIGQVLREKLDVRTLLVTRGGKGLMLYRQDVPPLHVPPIPVEVYDVAGAGDTVISTLTLGIAAGGSIEDSAFVANHAAACVVRKVGVATVTVAEILGDQ